MPNGAPRNGGPPIPSTGAVDLGAVKEMTGEKAEEGRFYAEMQQGMRCGGCGGRVSSGLRFTQFKTEFVDGRPTAVAAVRTACTTREDCDYAQRLGDTADVAEMVEFAWIDEDGPAKPPPKSVIDAQARRQAQQRKAAESSSGER